MKGFYYFLLPLVLYITLVVVPRGRSFWIALGICVVAAVLVTIGIKAWIPGEGQPGHRIARAYGGFAVWLAFSSVIAGTIIQGIHALIAGREGTRGWLYWVMAVAGLLLAFSPYASAQR